MGGISRRFCRTNFDLLAGSSDRSNFSLESSVGNGFDSEVEHEAFGELLGQLIEERAPRGMLDHLLQPRGRLTCLEQGKGNGG